VEKIKKVFQSASSRNGSYSAGLIALIICIVIVVNMIAGQLPENIKKIDISDNRIYEISDTSRTFLNDLDKEVTFKIFAEKSAADERIKTFIQKYAALSGKIKVEWIDPVLHPSELSENNVEENNILISCKDTEKSTVVTFDEILVVDEYSYYMTGSASPTEFDGEGQLTSAVNYVTSDTTKKIYYTTGHGEKTFSLSVTELLDKNNMSNAEVNLIMDNKIPDDCDLLFLYAPTSDITEAEKELILSYLSEGGKVFILLTEMKDEAPNLDTVLNEYGMLRETGYIADVQRCYQGNYYYIFPEIMTAEGITDSLSSDMVLLVNAHGLTVADVARDTISVNTFMTTSSEAYAVTEENEKQGTYTIGAVATESIDENKEETEHENGEEGKEDSESADADESKESRLTVISAETLIDSQVTDAFSALENLDVFMNAVSANFDDVENIAIEAKSLEVVMNTMRHAGVISLFIIFGIPAVILIFGFTRWWKRRKS